MGLGSALLDILFPPKCAFCGRVMDRNTDGICPACQKALPWSAPADRKADFVRSVTAPLYYEGTVREALLRYKFHFTPARGQTFGKLIGRELRSREHTDFDVLTWVPLSAKRKRIRGYDQAQLLARAAAEELGVTVTPLLKKQRKVPPQSGIRTPEARRANVSGCYDPEDPEAVTGARILLVDDIVTTGATLSECARVLMLAGAENVVAVTLAAARREK